jgi:hypothetical protein
MPRLLVRNLSISLDGYVAGPRQDLANPLGVGGMQLHEWLFATRSFNRMIGREGGSEGLDDSSSRRGELVLVPPSWGEICSARSGALGE